MASRKASAAAFKDIAMASSSASPLLYWFALSTAATVFDRTVGLGQKFSIGYEAAHLARIALDGKHDEVCVTARLRTRARDTGRDRSIMHVSSRGWKASHPTHSLGRGRSGRSGRCAE